MVTFDQISIQPKSVTVAGRVTIQFVLIESSLFIANIMEKGFEKLSVRNKIITAIFQRSCENCKPQRTIFRVSIALRGVAARDARVRSADNRLLAANVLLEDYDFNLQVFLAFFCNIRHLHSHNRVPACAYDRQSCCRFFSPQQQNTTCTVPFPVREKCRGRTTTVSIHRPGEKWRS